MEPKTTIKGMLSRTHIFVPDYQRSYSWRTGNKQNNKPLEVNQFLIDLEEYKRSARNSPYYFGHFLFEECKENKGRNLEYAVVDGQQRLTTIEIFLSALFKRLTEIRELSDDELDLKDDLIIKRNKPNFRTVKYDDLFFQDYVITQTRSNSSDLDTSSAKRIAEAFDFFSQSLAEKDEVYITEMLDIVSQASCTTHTVVNDTEAMQMFLFQNNRGKRPSNLEIIKTQFMYVSSMSEDAYILIDEINGRFEKIYKSISCIDDAIDEDTVLALTIRIYGNTLWNENPQDWINKRLKDERVIVFIREFTQELMTCFDHLKTFYGSDRQSLYGVDTLITLGGITDYLPFVLKAYKNNVSKEDLSRLCKELACLRLRERITGTRAEILTRIEDVYKNFTSDSIQDIISRIDYIKSVDSKDWWWAYWNNDKLKENLYHLDDRNLSKFILWQYENHLMAAGKSGYKPMSMSEIASPQLEHISPQTPTNGEPVAAGYDDYDEAFCNECIDNLGNYLLLSASHNESIGNKPFVEKRASYTQLLQQREIQDMTDEHWGREQINKRQDKLIEFVMNNF